MNSNRTFQSPLSAGGYAPYFYQSGRFQTDFPMTSFAPGDASYRTEAVYDFTSDLTRIRRESPPQTVEQIIAQGYFAVPGDDPTTAILSDKIHSSRLGLDDAIGQMRSRILIYQTNMQDLEQSVCEANNAVFSQEADQGCPANEKQRYSANKMIQKIYEQKRDERVNLWRDLSRVRTTLPEIVQQYLSAYRKVAILDGIQGDEP